MKRILCVILSVLVLSAGVAAQAADDADGSITVTYTTGGKLTDNYEQSNFLNPVSDMQPGDSVTLTAEIVNQKNVETLWYMSNTIVRSMEESSEGTGSAYSYKLTYSGPGGEQTIFDSDTVGGEDSEGLSEATEGLDDLFYLDTLKAGQSGVVTLEITLDGETEGNDYMNSLAELKMNFGVEERAQSTSTTGNKVGKVVQTGDNTKLFPYYIAMSVSGLLLLVLAADCLRRRRKEDEQ